MRLYLTLTNLQPQDLAPYGLACELSEFLRDGSNTVEPLMDGTSSFVILRPSEARRRLLYRLFSALMAAEKLLTSCDVFVYARNGATPGTSEIEAISCTVGNFRCLADSEDDGRKADGR